MKKKFILALLAVALVVGTAGADSTLPVSFDLRATNVVPEIRNQGSWGTCWAFASMAASETNYLTQVKDGAENFLKVSSKDIDLSEMHLAWFLHMTPKRYQRFTTSATVKKNGRNVKVKIDNPTALQVLSHGGWDFKAIAMLSRGVGWGPVLEKDCPYIGSVHSNTYQGIIEEKEWNWTDNEDEIRKEFALRTNTWCNEKMKKKPEDYKTVLRLTDASYLSHPQRSLLFDNYVDEIKRLVMEKGALFVCYYSAADKQFYGDGAYFYTDKTRSKKKKDRTSKLDPRWNINHAVTLIGWDDNYPVENFKGPEKPSQPGAWLVRNSWGKNATRHKDGYLWISYEQYMCCSSAFTMEKPNPTMKAYFYDDLGRCDSWGEDGARETSSAANVFQVRSSGEALSEIGFYTTGLDASVKVDIYGCGAKHPKNAFTSGTLLASETEEYPLPGYHTLKLNTPVGLTSGDYFAVVLTAANAETGNPIAVEKRMSLLSDYASVGDGESYFLQDGKWEDGAFHTETWKGQRVVTPMNACIKAFTIDPTYEEKEKEKEEEEDDDEDEKKEDEKKEDEKKDEEEDDEKKDDEKMDDDEDYDDDDTISGVKIESYPTVTVTTDSEVIDGRQVSVKLVSNDKKPLPKGTKAKMYFVLVEEDWDEDDEPDETLSSAVFLAGLHEATVPHSGIPTGHRQPDLPNAAKLAASRKPGSLADEDDDEVEFDELDEFVMDDDFIEESFDVDPFYTAGFKPDRIFVDDDGMAYPVYGPREVTVGEGGAVTLDADKENLPEGFYNVLYVAGAVTGDLPVIRFTEGGVPDEDDSEDDKYWDDEGTKPAPKKSHGGCDAGIAGGLTLLALAARLLSLRGAIASRRIVPCGYSAGRPCRSEA